MQGIAGVFVVLAVAVTYVNAQGCIQNPCFNGGSCNDYGGGQFTCTCVTGYVGIVCEAIDIGAGLCATNPCLNGGSCLVQPGGAFKCLCTDGYDGRFCEQDLGPAVTVPTTISPICNPNPCDNGGVCSNTNNMFKCTCPAGWLGTFCHQAAGTAAPTVNTPPSDLGPAVTVPTTISPICNPNPCDNGGVCSNTNNMFKCTCPAGWVGTFCHQAALTAAPTGPTTTVNTLCDQNPCSNGGTCSSAGSGFASSFSCACVPGFSGLFCQSGSVTSAPTTVGTTATPRICLPNPCDNGGTCTSPDGGSFACACTPGFMGTFCHQVDPNSVVQVTIATTTIPRLCNPNPCDNGGVCSSNDTSTFECTCVNGYTGTFCHTTPEICTPNPCANGGQCGSSRPGGFDCTCAPGYSGFFCQAAIATAQSQGLVPSSCSNDVNKGNLGCKPAEVVFLMSIGKEASLDEQGDFIKFLVDSWSIGNQGMRVGVVASAERYGMEYYGFNITEFTDDKSGLLTRIGTLTSTLGSSGEANIEAALDYARMNSFKNARPGVPQVVIPIINQTPYSTAAKASLVAAADRLKATCAVIIGEYVIGMPPNADLVEMVVSQPYVDYYNYFTGYLALESSGQMFDANACP